MHRAIWSGTLQSAVLVTLKGDRPVGWSPCESKIIKFWECETPPICRGYLVKLSLDTQSSLLGGFQMHRAIWSGTLQSAVLVTLKGDRPVGWSPCESKVIKFWECETPPICRGYLVKLSLDTPKRIYFYLRNFFKYLPVYDFLDWQSSSGEPVATTSPPCSPPSGPKSTI